MHVGENTGLVAERAWTRILPALHAGSTAARCASSATRLVRLLSAEETTSSGRAEQHTRMTSVGHPTRSRHWRGTVPTHQNEAQMQRQDCSRRPASLEPPPWCFAPPAGVRGQRSFRSDRPPSDRARDCARPLAPSGGFRIQPAYHPNIPPERPALGIQCHPCAHTETKMHDGKRQDFGRRPPEVDLPPAPAAQTAASGALRSANLFACHRLAVPVGRALLQRGEHGPAATQRQRTRWSFAPQ